MHPSSTVQWFFFPSPMWEVFLYWLQHSMINIERVENRHAMTNIEWNENPEQIVLILSTSFVDISETIYGGTAGATMNIDDKWWNDLCNKMNCMAIIKMGNEYFSLPLWLLLFVNVDERINHLYLWNVSAVNVLLWRIWQLTRLLTINVLRLLLLLPHMYAETERIFSFSWLNGNFFVRQPH